MVVQTSGQLRDIAASRLELINDAIAMAAEAHDEEYGNYVRKDSRMPNACCSKRDSLRQTHANMRANGYSAV